MWEPRSLSLYHAAVSLITSLLPLSHPVLPLTPSLSQISTSGPNPWSKPRLAESKTILYQFTQIFLSCYSKVRPDRLVPFPQSTPKHPCLFISKSHNSTFPHEMLQFRPETVSLPFPSPQVEPAPRPQSVPPKPGRLQPDCPPAPPPELQTPGSSLGRGVSAVAKCFPPPADS